MTILLCFHFGSFHNFKHYYLFYVKEHLRKEFPNQLSYNRFMEVEHKVAIPLVLFLKLICFGECSGITFGDSTKIAVCHNKRINLLAALAAYCFFDKKPSIRFEREPHNKQLGVVRK